MNKVCGCGNIVNHTNRFILNKFMSYILANAVNFYFREIKTEKQRILGYEKQSMNIKKKQIYIFSIPF